MPRSRAARDVCIRSEAPWMKRRQHNRPGGDQPQPTVTHIPASLSVDEEVLQKAAHLSRELTVRLGDEDVVTLEGLAGLVVADDSGPNFSAAGYFLEATTKECWAVSIKVMVPRMDCQQEASWSILLVQLHCHRRGATVCALSERHGDDAVSLSPLCPSSHQFLCPGVTPAATPHARFVCTMMKDHGEAPEAAPAWCRALVRPGGAVLNLGHMSIAGVPLRLL